MNRQFLLAIALCCAAPAQAADDPFDIDFKLGIVQMSTADGGAFAGIGGRYALNETFAISGEFLTTVSDVEITTGPFTFETLDLTQYGLFVEAGKGDDDWRTALKLGFVRSDATLTGVPSTDLSDTTPAIGIEFVWRFIGISWTHTEIEDRSLDTSAIFVRF
jgi:hypothetical protein